jgi:hypothetical protein
MPSSCVAPCHRSALGADISDGTINCVCVTSLFSDVQRAVAASIPVGVDMNVNILTSGYWPTYPVVDANLPAELNNYQQVWLLSRSGRGISCCMRSHHHAS